MQRLIFLLICLSLPVLACAEDTATSLSSSTLAFTVKSVDGLPVPLLNFRGKVQLIVNTASKCGFTPQYHDLEDLYNSYKDKDFTILAFPSNDFDNQEPGTNEEIKQFCNLRFGVSFPVYEKGSVTGDSIQPLYRVVLESAPDELKGPVMWNFEKIVVDEKGEVRGRFSSVVNPLNSRVTELIEKLLTEKSGSAP